MSRSEEEGAWLTGPHAARKSRIARELQRINVKKPCLYPDCLSEQSCRGLCLNHNNQRRYLTNHGLAEEEDLIERGLVLPSKRIPTGEVIIRVYKNSFFRKGSRVRGREGKIRD